MPSSLLLVVYPISMISDSDKYVHRVELQSRVIVCIFIKKLISSFQYIKCDRRKIKAYINVIATELGLLGRLAPF